ncbi:hypothetical protein PPO43_04860 [Saprospira sp. CCB-QB6]|uniref:hypothetical protein n=1 Tax=Saprospira sp. CCB-QB6 TaxID=3023936 RepID=UPI00234B5280|nr:hypothetical protein [Saprospira sp. CCB-QB6]WCL82428.1 hypothetical protein PPO43_04860 [Saprospira sp. CCB-QB6]
MGKTKEEKPLLLQLDMQEINKILQALGQRPFNEVYELIGKIHEQANAQMHAEEPPKQLDK